MDGASEALSSCEKAIGHTLITSTDTPNVAATMIRNVLFSLDDHRLAKETMATMDKLSDD
jgi:hypothetical protein